jgi:phosphatidylglycerophosphate synthase
MTKATRTGQARAVETKLTQAPEGVVFVVDGPGREIPVAGMTGLNRSLLGFDKAGVSGLTLVLGGCDDADAVRATLHRKVRDRVRFVTRDEAETDVDVLRRIGRADAAQVTWRSNVVVGPKDADAIVSRAARNGRVLDVAGGLVRVLTPSTLATPGCATTADVAAAASASGRLDAMDPTHVVCDFDRPAKRREVLKGLVDGLKKPLMIDGLMGIYFQRPITTRISPLLARTPITPNQLTAVAMVLGVASGFFVAAGGAWAALGGLMFVVGGLVDCLDGEVARLKFHFSSWGEWFDTIADDLSTTSFIAGMSVFMYTRYPSPQMAALGVVAVGAFVAIQLLQYWKCITVYHTGDLCAIEYNYGGQGSSKLGDLLKLLVKRDLFSLLFFLTAVAGVLEISFALTLIGGLSALFAVALQYVADLRARTAGAGTPNLASAR